MQTIKNPNATKIATTSLKVSWDWLADPGYGILEGANGTGSRPVELGTGAIVVLDTTTLVFGCPGRLTASLWRIIEVIFSISKGESLVKQIKVQTCTTYNECRRPWYT